MVTDNRCTQNQALQHGATSLSRWAGQDQQWGKHMQMIFGSLGRPRFASELLTGVRALVCKLGTGTRVSFPRARQVPQAWSCEFLSGTQGQSNDDRVVHYASLECWLSSLHTSHRQGFSRLGGAKSTWGEEGMRKRWLQTPEGDFSCNSWLHFRTGISHRDLRQWQKLPYGRLGSE